MVLNTYIYMYMYVHVHCISYFNFFDNYANILQQAWAITARDVARMIVVKVHSQKDGTTTAIAHREKKFKFILIHVQVKCILV